MGHRFIITRKKLKSSRRSYSRRRIRRAAWHASAGKIVLGRKVLSYSIISLLLVMGISYLVLINSRVSKAFEVEKMEKKITVLKKQNQNLQQKVAEMQSIQNIQDGTNETGLVPAGSVVYIGAEDYAVATGKAN